MLLPSNHPSQSKSRMSIQATPNQIVRKSMAILRLENEIKAFNDKGGIPNHGLCHTQISPIQLNVTLNEVRHQREQDQIKAFISPPYLNSNGFFQHALMN